MSHSLHTFEFTSLTSESWDSFPDSEKLRKHIAGAVLAYSELSGNALGFYSPPKDIREILVTQAVFDQVLTMWHGHRDKNHIAPPSIPLKLFVFWFRAGRQ